MPGDVRGIPGAKSTVFRGVPGGSEGFRTNNDAITIESRCKKLGENKGNCDLCLGIPPNEQTPFIILKSVWKAEYA